MMSKDKHIVPAFTIFEVTVVVAIMSVIISIIAVTVNRFNEQLKVSTDLSGELNEWYAFRSNLWREFYLSDSIRMKEGVCSIYGKDKEVSYRISNDHLARSTGGDWNSTGFEMESIKHNEREQRFDFNFQWKGEVMTMSYPDKPSIKASIDNYFARLK